MQELSYIIGSKNEHINDDALGELRSLIAQHSHSFDFAQAVMYEDIAFCKCAMEKEEFKALKVPFHIADHRE